MAVWGVGVVGGVVELIGIPFYVRMERRSALPRHPKFVQETVSPSDALPCGVIPCGVIF